MLFGLSEFTLTGLFLIDGVKLLSQVGEVSYHDFPGIKLDEESKESLINSFGSSSRVWLSSFC